MPTEGTGLAKKYSDHVETVATGLLSQILRPDFGVSQVYYPNPDRPGELTEVDTLLGVDDVLLIVEVKSGGLSAAASRGAPMSLASALSDLIIAGQHQSERAERYIKSSPEALFYDETGKEVVHRLRAANYRRMFRVVVTAENLGWVGARIAALSVLDPGLSQSYPWHVSLDDLRIIAALFAGKNIDFAHFLEQRLRASAHAALSQHDEIEHVALYQKQNQYHDFSAGNMTQVSFDPSYMRDIDIYLAARYAGESVSPPEQSLPPNMLRLIEALRASGVPGRFEAGSVLLSMGSGGRNEFNASLAALEPRRAAGRQPGIHLPFSSDRRGVSITHASDQNLLEETARCAARMHQGGHARWLIVQLDDRADYVVKTITVITPGAVAEEELSRGQLYLDRQVASVAATRRIERNERCPCGSGRKYKLCHGR
jgi:hypothetical protein